MMVPKFAWLEFRISDKCACVVIVLRSITTRIHVCLGLVKVVLFQNF